jgi:hypothetical protein
MRIQNTVRRQFLASYINLPYLPLTGLNGAGNNITFAVSQAALLYSINGAAWSSSAFSNSTAYATIFQEYRILEFSIEVFTSINTATAPATLSSGDYFPMMYGVIDREDAVGLISPYAALQYATVQVTQLGSTQGSKTILLKSPAVFTAFDNSASFGGTISAAGATRSPWLSCGTNSAVSTPASIPHGYIKYFVDNLGSTLSTTQFQTTFICRVIMEYRGID